MSDTPTRSKAEADALWAAVLSGTVPTAPKRSRARTQGQKKRSKHKRKSASAYKQAMDLLALLRDTPQAPPQSPWSVTALVLPVIHTRCACGQVHSSPSAEVLVRFTHKDGSIQDRKGHPSRFRTDLPRTLSHIHMDAEHCPSCFQTHEHVQCAEGAQISCTAPVPVNGQLDLFQVPSSDPLPLAVPVGPCTCTVPERKRLIDWSSDLAPRPSPTPVQFRFETKTVVITQSPIPAHYHPLVPLNISRKPSV